MSKTQEGPQRDEGEIQGGCMGTTETQDSVRVFPVIINKEIRCTQLATNGLVCQNGERLDGENKVCGYLGSRLREGYERGSFTFSERDVGTPIKLVNITPGRISRVVDSDTIEISLEISLNCDRNRVQGTATYRRDSRNQNVLFPIEVDRQEHQKYFRHIRIGIIRSQGQLEMGMDESPY